jgi:hypothetical protein
VTKPLTDLELEAAAYSAASYGKNDPSYHEDIRDTARKVDAVANEVVGVNIIDGRDPHIQIRVKNPRNNPVLTNTARTMGELFEAPVVRSASAMSNDVSHKQPMRHRHYNDDSK